LTPVSTAGCVIVIAEALIRGDDRPPVAAEWDDIFVTGSRQWFLSI
jgi:hypothetical protein